MHNQRRRTEVTVELTLTESHDLPTFPVSDCSGWLFGSNLGNGRRQVESRQSSHCIGPERECRTRLGEGSCSLDDLHATSDSRECDRRCQTCNPSANHKYVVLGCCRHG